MENTTIDKTLPIESEEVRLLQECEELTKKLTKQKLILSAMTEIDVNDIKDVDEAGKKNIDLALDFVRAYDYLKMDNACTNVLGKFLSKFIIQSKFFRMQNVHFCISIVAGLPDQPHELSYVEKRALKAKVLEELPKYYEKELEFCRRMEPEIINPEILDKQLLDLKAREKEQLAELARSKIELCDECKKGIEMRFGPNEAINSELTKAKFKIEQVKAQ